MANKRQDDPIKTGGVLVGERGPELIIFPDGARYLSDGSAFISGVPTRDLSAEEWAALPEDLRALCLEAGLYKAVAPKDASGA